MNDEPTQPLTDAELMEINYNLNEALNRCGELYLVTDAPKDMRRLLAEVDRLRSELANLRTVLITAHEAGMSLGQDVERLQSQRDALVCKLGLNWGPDEFGDLDAVPDPSSGDVSDGYHTHNELYAYRMLYNAHAVIGWLDAGYRVVKSWRHSDGELCSGGDWFVVAAELPTGQVTNHYEADHWDLFVIPEETPPAYDGHSPVEAAHRLRQALGWGGDPVDS